MIPSVPFGVQSYCFREFKDNAVVAGKVRDLGLDSIELCRVHANFDDPSAFEDVVAVYRTAGVSILSLGVQTFEGHAHERRWFECAAAAGARHISCHFRVDSFMRAIPLVRKCHGVRHPGGLHNHGGYMFGGQPDVIAYLLELGGPEIGLCIDTAWALQIGPNHGNPVKLAEKFAGHIYGVHLKDFVFDPPGQHRDVIVGQGNLDLPAFMAALRAGGFDGVTVIEYEGDAENPDPALKQCIESMRASLR